MRNGSWGSTNEEKVALGHFVISFAEDSWPVNTLNVYSLNAWPLLYLFAKE